MLSLHQLEIFYTVARSRTFGEAADKLYITQPAVSQHIKMLEANLGTSLFNRSRRGVTLTPAGETLFEYTTEILRLVAQAENAVTDVRNLADGQTLIGATPNISSYLLPNWIRDFRERFPNITTSVKTDVTARIIEDVRDHHLDIGFIEGEIEALNTDGMGWLVLEDVPQVVVVGRDHPWWENQSIHVDMLNQQRMVTRQRNSQTRIWLDGVLSNYSVIPKVTGEFDNPEAIKHAVSSGQCMTIMPEYAIQRDCEMGIMRKILIQDVDLRRELKLVWDQERVFSPVTRTFLDFLSGFYPELKLLITA